MKKSFFRLLLVALILVPTQLFAQGKSVFVLVDVSGTMKNVSINSEAKNQISALIDGKYTLSDWTSIGWSVEANTNFLGTRRLVADNQIFCFMPFGNEGRIQDRTKILVSGDNWKQEFENSFNSLKFRDQLTYNELAKAYVGCIAQSSDIKSAYVIIYSDEMKDQTSQGGEYSTKIVNNFRKAKDNALQLKAHLKKSDLSRIYNITIYEFTPYPTENDKWHDGICVKPKDDKDDEGDKDDTGKRGQDLPRRPLKITSPKEGESNSQPLEISKGENIKISWQNENNPIVTILNANGKDRINNNDNAVYLCKSSVNSATITFYKPGDYKVKVSGQRGVDQRYVSVKDVFPILPILIIIAIILIAVLVYKIFNKKHGPATGPNEWTDGGGKYHSGGKSQSSGSKSDMDW